METDEQVAQLEKAEVESQLEVALRRIVELEEQLKCQEESFQATKEWVCFSFFGSQILSRTLSPLNRASQKSGGGEKEESIQ